MIRVLELIEIEWLTRIPDASWFSRAFAVFSDQNWPARGTRHGMAGAKIPGQFRACYQARPDPVSLRLNPLL